MLQSVNIPFPNADIIGKRFKHKCNTQTKAGKPKTEWFKGTFLCKANPEDLKDLSPEDQLYMEKGYSLFIIDYDKENDLEAEHALQDDWENGDIQLI